MKLSPQQVRAFQKIVLDFFRRNGRRLPWRGTRDPYKIFVSEIMLQQTRVSRAILFYEKFIRAFPTVRVLASAPARAVLCAWSGLGYNRRALFLKRAAESIVREHDGEVPRDFGKLCTLPGIGRATAAAILAYAWNEPVVFVETNIRTALIHHFFSRRKKVRDAEILEAARQTVPNNVRPFSRFPPAPGFGRAGKVRPCRTDFVEPCSARGVYSEVLENIRIRRERGRKDNSRYSYIPRNVGMLRKVSVREWYSALMDYGAHLKETVGNAARRSAAYAQQGRFKGSARELRGEIIRCATRGRAVRAADFAAFARRGLSVGKILHALVAEGFLQKRGAFFVIRG